MGERVYLVWNTSRTECVGFKDKKDAEQAAGLKSTGNPCSSLVVEWRDMYADEFGGEQPDESERIKFQIQEIHI